MNTITTAFLTLIFLLASSVAVACPDLAGAFVCTTPEGKEDIVVSQRVENNITVYKINNDEYLADGLAKPINEDDMKGSYIVSCVADRVKLVADVTAVDNSYKGHQETAIYRTATGLKQESKLSIIADGKTESFDLSVECMSK